jgi:hypothetical protein
MNFVTLEWVASLMAAAGSAWFVNDVTRAFQRLPLVLPPTGGPTELIGISVLIWLYAKYQRHLISQPPPEFMAQL